MVYTVLITVLILGYMWGVEPAFGPQRMVSTLVAVAVLSLGALKHKLQGDGWGFDWSEFFPALAWVAAPTALAVVVCYLAGSQKTFSVGEVSVRLAFLIPWGLGQQFLLQTVIFHELRGKFTTGKAIVFAAGFFAMFHVPNPFLAPVTFAAGLIWCWVYSRHQNILALAISHAVGSLGIILFLSPEVTGAMRVGYGYFLIH